MKNLRFISITAILVLVLAGGIGIGKASAQTVCSPATAISVPFTIDFKGTACWQTTTLCNNINSWQMNKLEINGIDYKQQWVLASSIPPLNGGYTITFDGFLANGGGHFEIDGPCPGGGPTLTPTKTFTPAWPTETFTRTPTLGGSTATRTRTATKGPSLTATQTRTPTRASTACDTPYSCGTGTPVTPVTVVPTKIPSLTPGTPTGGTCSPAATITAPFVKDGAGTFCWRISTLGFINSYNLTNLSVNGSNFLNMWAAAANLPPQIGGYWYISYTSATQFGHFEAQP